MTDQNLTEIIALIDRSGSMVTIKSDMIGGFDTFVAEQRKLPGECVVSLYEFDDKFDVLFEEKPLAEVPSLPLEPRGMTALHDALGRAITLVGERLAAKPEEKRPGKVVFLIITDGAENSSREFKIKDVRRLVKHQTDVYGWQFAFLGANIDSFAVGGSYGVSGASTMDYQATAQGTQVMYASVGRSVSAYRTNATNSLSFATDEDEQKKDEE